MAGITSISQVSANIAAGRELGRGRVLSPRYLTHLLARADFSGMAALADNLVLSSSRLGMDGDDTKLTPTLLTALAQSPDAQHKEKAVDTALAISAEIRAYRILENPLSTAQETKAIKALTHIVEQNHFPLAGIDGLERQRKILAGLSQNHEFLLVREPSSSRLEVCKFLKTAQERAAAEFLDVYFVQQAKPLPQTDATGVRPDNRQKRPIMHLVQ